MSTAVLEAPGPTAIDLESLGDRHSDSLYEVVDGIAVEQAPMSTRAAILANELSWSINRFAREAGFGKAYGEVLIKLDLADRSRDRRPDVLFVPFAKWPAGKPMPDDSAWDVLPDICVEVVSPTDKVYDLEEKISEYFEAGVPQVWVVYPSSLQVEIFRSPHQTTLFSGRDVLTCPEILPGYELSLSEYFG